jgi:D-3-phosphoglycerate dehydrogenase
LITTVPFAENDRRPIEILEQADVEYVINPLGRKLKEEELAHLIPEFDVLIAGTEPIGVSVLSQASQLKLICRVGIGLDSVDLNEARRRDIEVCYTPDAPSPAVAELTIGLMLSILRSVHISNSCMHKGEWHRYFGRRLSEITIGIVGVGRIGSRVIEHLSGFGCKESLVNDLNTVQFSNKNTVDNIEQVSKDRLYRDSDLISLHVPLNMDTREMITKNEMSKMRKGALLVNTSRGGIINETDLYNALISGRLAAAAVDVFEKEPYSGPLSSVEQCLLTAHMGSMSVDCRSRMERESTEEVARFVNGETLMHQVPEEEYQNQEQGL